MNRKRTVNQEMAETFAASVNAVHIHTSAKMNEGVDDLFQTVAASIVKKNKPSSSGGGGQTQNIRILEDDQLETRGGCCK